MFAVVLAGGYAKRLWPLTLNKPKALLPVAGRPVIDYVIEKLTRLNPKIGRIVVSTNLRFQPQFEDWLQARTNNARGIELMPENSISEKEKLGAVRALAEVVEKIGEEDVLVLPGDNLFTDDLEGFVGFFREKHVPVVALFDAGSVDETRKGSNVIVDEDGRVLEFVEKSVHPTTTLVGAAIYAFPAGIGRRLKQYVRLGLNVDEPGRFIEWLHKQEPVYGYMFKEYIWDIGTLDSYEAADEFFLRVK
jgi:glucose-1-phosphate thymidylyltransferase